MRNRVVLLIAGGALVGGAVLLWPRPAAHSPPPGATPEAAAADPGVPAAPAVDEQQKERARAALRQMDQLAAQARSEKHPVASGPERRPGESEEFHKERVRALAEYQRFAHDHQIPAERLELLERAIVDAQQNWTAALKAAGRTQPQAPGAEMADPVLQQIFTNIDQDFRRAATGALNPAQAAMFNSYVPTVLPFIRTGAFELK